MNYSVGEPIRKEAAVPLDKILFLKSKQLTKRFGETVAVDNVDMEVYLGEIRGLIGENGSGKSTISYMISGIHSITSGDMFLGDRKYRPASPADAYNERISIIVQETGTIDRLTVAENIFLGREKRFCKWGWFDREAMNAEAQKALAAIGADDITASDSIDLYNFEQRKIIEIAKALYYNPLLFIVDETTTALSHDGRLKIYKIMQNLKEQNNAVLFISHDLNELMEVCDVLTVLRDGKLIANIEKADFDEEMIKQTMVGRELNKEYYRSDYDYSHSGEVMLSLCDVSTELLKKIDLQVHAGEIVGLGGLSGSGIHDVGKVCFGIERAATGAVYAKAPREPVFKEKIAANFAKLRGKPQSPPDEMSEHKIESINDALNARIGYISKDRDKETLILESSVKDNLNLSALDMLQIFGFIPPSAERRFAVQQIDEFRIKCSSGKQPVKELSGGNKQKVSFGKWIGNNSQILVFDSPTRGVDVGVKTTMYQLLYKLKKQGHAILIISEELPELIGMCDRICIFKNGRITETFTRAKDLTDGMIIGHMI